MAKPKFFFNDYGVNKGYPWAGTEATLGVSGGAESAVDLGRNLSNGIKLEHIDTTASRSFIDLGSSCRAGVWCAILVEIVDFDLTNYSGDTGANAPIKNSTTTNIDADVSLSDRIVTFDDITNGGVGWYCIWMKYSATTSPTIRCGLGTDGDMTNGAGYITIGRVGFFTMLQNNAEPSTSGNVPSFAIPGFPAAYSVTGNTVDANKKVTWGSTGVGTIDRYSVIYAIGDSKSDNFLTDTPTSLPNTTDIACYTYAKSGQGYDYMVTNIADLQAKYVDSFENGNRDFWPDMEELPQTPLSPNCLMFSNFGVNDINGATYTSTQEVANFVSMASTLGYNDVIITELSPWGAYIGASAGEVTETKAFNTLAKSTCEAKGWVFVPLYYALGDRPANPDNIVNPTYSTDDLHPVGTGSRVIDGLIKCALDEARQRNFP